MFRTHTKVVKGMGQKMKMTGKDLATKCLTKLLFKLLGKVNRHLSLRLRDGKRPQASVERAYQRKELEAKGQWIMFRESHPLYTAHCPACIFGDRELTCTCTFRSQSPDFKLYEDEDLFTVDELDQTVWI